MVDFLDHHFEMSRDSAIDATESLRVVADHQPFNDTTFSLAVYIVPEADSSLYQFGSTVIGYDCRNSSQIAVPRPDEVGNACSFGFHLTVCDALYFFNARDRERAIAEVAFRVRETPSFELTNLVVQKSFPSRSYISIAAQDPSGILEILHCELVSSVYRRAAGSEYTRGEGYAKESESQERRREMIRRFHAPHILSQYSPHFTLLSNVSPQNMDERREQLEREFRARVRPRKLSVKKIALLSRIPGEDTWKIIRELSLAGS
jgi:hypothetical protein